MEITATAELETLARLAFKTGVPQDQLTAFLQAGYVPQPKGLLFHRYAREADAPGGPTAIAMGGTRGQAKSHAIFAQTVLDDMQRFAGLKVLYLRKIGSKAVESFEDLRRKVCAFIPHDTKNGILTLTNDSFMVLGGFRSEAEIDSYLGLEYELIVIEDATTLSKIKIDAVLGALRTSRDDYRPRVYLSFNPGGIGHAWAKKMFYDPYSQGRETETRFIHVTMGDNRFINPEYEAYLNGLTGWLRRAWRDGDFTIAAGQFFVNFNPAIHLKEPPRPLPLGWRYWASFDYGFVHWLVCHLFGQDGDGNIYVIDEHAERRWLAAQHAPAIMAMLARHNLTVSHLSVIAAGHDVFAERGTTQTIAQEYATYGLSLSPAKIDRINGAARLLTLLGSETQPARLFFSQRCVKAIETIPEMQHDPRRPEDVLKVDCDSDTGAGGDDAYDSVRMGVMEFGQSSSGPNPLANYRG